MRTFQVFLSLSVLACSGGTEPGPVEVCDGSSEVRLAIRVVVDPGLLELGQQVMYDNGATFLFVDGTCTAHVKTSELWGPTLKGPVSDVTSLVGDLRVARWKEWAGVYEGGATDGSTVLFEDGEVFIACTNGCTDVAQDIEELPDAAHAWIERLAMDAEAVSGPVRVSVVRYERGPEASALEWPLATDIDDLAVDEVDVDLEFGSGRLIEGDDADILRSIREEYRAGEHGLLAPYIPFRIDGDTQFSYWAYYRDVLPFEDPDGLVPAFHDPESLTAWPSDMLREE